MNYLWAAMIAVIFNILSVFGVRKLKLPHPEEPVNYAQTAANTSVANIFGRWFADYEVPQEYWEYWQRAIVVEIHDTWPPEKNMPADASAVSWGEGSVRHLAVLARWLNPGTICHEQCHNSYALLSTADKGAFSSAWTTARLENPLVQLVTREHPYALASDVEGHAEIGRFLGQFMPEQLKRFYPKLFAEVKNAN